MQRAVLKQQTKQLLRRTVGEPYVGKRIKLRRVAHLLPDLGLRPAAILDAGAEDATFVYWLADFYPQAMVSAVDLDAAAIAACVAARPARYETSVQFRVGSFDALQPESFDLITAFDVLEHITDDHGAVADLMRALQPGGTLLVHVPRDRWLERSGTIHALPDERAWQINPGHVRQGYSPESMRALLTGAGLDVVDVQTWVGRAGTFAHSFYGRVEHPVALRALSIPVTDVCAWLDRRRSGEQGNTVYARAIKPR